jgi:hypothetical protein
MDKYAGMFPDSTMGGFYESFKLKYNIDSNEPSKKFVDYVAKHEDQFLKKDTEYFLEAVKKENDKTGFIGEFLNLYSENKKDKKLVEDIWRDLHILFGLSRRCIVK